MCSYKKTNNITYLLSQLLPPLCGGESDIWRWRAQTLSRSSSFPWPAALGFLCECSQRQNELQTPGAAEDTWRNLFVPQDEGESRNRLLYKGDELSVVH